MIKTLTFSSKHPNHFIQSPSYARKGKKRAKRRLIHCRVQLCYLQYHTTTNGMIFLTDHAEHHCGVRSQKFYIT